jgi:hypothetical protein
MNLKYNSSSTLLALYVLSLTSSSASAFTTFSPAQRPSFAIGSTTSKTEDAFSAFADSLDEDELFNDNSSSSDSNDIYAEKTWQESVEQLLDPTTPLAKRQILLTDLLNSNDDIREDVLAALKDRKVRIWKSSEKLPFWLYPIIFVSICQLQAHFFLFRVK